MLKHEVRRARDTCLKTLTNILDRAQPRLKTTRTTTRWSPRTRKERQHSKPGTTLLLQPKPQKDIYHPLVTDLGPTQDQLPVRGREPPAPSSPKALEIPQENQFQSELFEMKWLATREREAGA